MLSEEARQQAQAEGLTLLVTETKTGYFGVSLDSRGYSKPYQAKVRRGGKQVSLGSFATAEQAALCVARSPEGREAVERAAAARPASPALTSEQARQQARAEGLTLRVAESKTGYFGVDHQPDRSKPYQARVTRGGKKVFLGSFATAEEAALYVARSPEGREAAERAEAARPPSPALTSEEARQQAPAEGLTLLVADNKTGYLGVHHNPGRSKPNNKTGFSGVHHQPGKSKPYKARAWRNGKQVYLGSFVTAEEAALCVTRSPEGQVAMAAAAERATAAPPLTSEEARQQAQAEGLTLRVADNSTGYFSVCHDQRDRSKLKPYRVQVRYGGKVVYLGSFATAEEAALSVARSPEAQAAAQRAAAAPPPLMGDDDGGDDTGEESEEEIVEVLDAVEVLVESDDCGDEEALTIEAKEVTLVVKRKRLP
eukprot:scaffold93724_cov54-Phaeocystis_antarctica.AAC.4